MPYLIKDKIEFLSDASKILSSSLDYNVTLASLAKLIVNSVADFCMIDISKNGSMKRVAIRVSNHKLQKIANEFYKYSPDPKNKKTMYDGAKARKPVIIKRVTKSWLKTVSKIEEERMLVEKLNHKSYIFAPLISREKIIGVMTIASGGKSYSELDGLFFQELAIRAGTAVDKARLYKEARDAIRDRDEFLAIASHELRTPLTSILLNLQLVLRKIRNTEKNKLNMENIVKSIEYSESQSYRLAKLINDLLNISVVSSGRLKIEKEKMEFSGLVEKVLNKFDAQFKDAKVQVDFKNGEEVFGFWDKVRLEQVISNLLSNSIKYGRGNPVVVSLEKENKKLIFSVKDTGIGIDKKRQKHVFEKFSRAVATKEFKGLGVGLYISRQIVEAHDGKIFLSSKKNEGTTFQVELPI